MNSGRWSRHNGGRGVSRITDTWFPLNHCYYHFNTCILQLQQIRITPILVYMEGRWRMHTTTTTYIIKPTRLHMFEWQATLWKWGRLTAANSSHSEESLISGRLLLPRSPSLHFSIFLSSFLSLTVRVFTNICMAGGERVCWTLGLFCLLGHWGPAAAIHKIIHSPRGPVII